MSARGDSGRRVATGLAAAALRAAGANGGRKETLNGAAAEVRPGQEGAALLAALILVFVLGGLGFAHLKSQVYEAEDFHRRLRDEKAFWLAETGLTYGLARLGSEPPPEFREYAERDTGRFTLKVRITRARSPRFPEWRITALVYDNFDGERGAALACSLTQTAVPAGVSGRYFWLEDHSEDRFYYTGDTLDGPVHTNTRFGMAGSPVFLDSIFEMAGGVEKGYVTHPDYAATPILKSAVPRSGEVYVFDHMADWIRDVEPADKIVAPPEMVVTIELQGAVMEVSYRDVADPLAVLPGGKRPVPESGGLYVDGPVEVKGVLGKTLTLGSSGNIGIVGDLVYEGSDPVTGRPDPESGVYLSLISEKNVQVRAPQDRDDKGAGIRINAAIVAMDQSFEVTNFRAHAWDMGVMHLWGSVAQVLRGQIGAVKANDTFRGYHKSWHFDRRLRNARLPYTPPLIRADGRMEFEPSVWGPFAWVE